MKEMTEEEIRLAEWAAAQRLRQTTGTLKEDEKAIEEASRRINASVSSDVVSKFSSNSVLDVGKDFCESGKKTAGGDAAKKTKKKCIHEGHRSRTIDTAFQVGLQNMSSIQILEAFLYYVYPRIDTNVIAHRLLDRFENFTNVICASLADLMAVEGVNERAAKMIILFRQFVYEFETAHLQKKVKINKKSDLIDLCEHFLRFQNVEKTLLVAISSSKSVTHKRVLSSNSATEISFDINEIYQFLSTSKQPMFVVAHCHPFGKAVPSDDDFKAFDLIKSMCNNMGVDLVDSYIVGEDGVFSMGENKYFREYKDVEDLSRDILFINS